MRKISFFEAYIDRPDTINVYMSELHYQGISTFFYLMDNQDEKNLGEEHVLTPKVVDVDIEKEMKTSCGTLRNA